MANVNGGSSSIWDTVDANAVKSGSALINAIVITAGATGGTTTLTSNGTAFISFSVNASSDVGFHFTRPVPVNDLTLTAIGTNVVVHVFYA